MNPSPDYFDLQVNGYGGVDFNSDDLSPEALHEACRLLASHGVGGILATFITEKLEVMQRRIRRLVELRQADPLASRIIAGLHIEGPFLNELEGFRGAHPADAMMPADESAMGGLLEAGAGLTRLVTLAPERDAGLAVTRMLARQGVRVSAGHTDASAAELERAIDAGLSLFTHLGNGCPMKMHRHQNIVQRALWVAGRRAELWVCFIADGVHVPPMALANYLRLTGPQRCIAVTDAIAPAGLGPGRYKLSRWELNIGPDMVARSPDGSHFVGAAITMPATLRNLIELAGLDEADARNMVDQNPRRAMGLA